jgi:hypothetical protein
LRYSGKYVAVLPNSCHRSHARPRPNTSGLAAAYLSFEHTQHTHTWPTRLPTQLPHPRERSVQYSTLQYSAVQYSAPPTPQEPCCVAAALEYTVSAGSGCGKARPAAWRCMAASGALLRRYLRSGLLLVHKYNLNSCVELAV